MELPRVDLILILVALVVASPAWSLELSSVAINSAEPSNKLFSS
jgi:hypothetical protein